jgi:tetratricopeptide (TPR) repeat protein
MASQAPKRFVVYQLHWPVRKAQAVVMTFAFAISLIPAPARSGPSVGELAHFVVQIHASKAGSGVVVESAGGRTIVLTARHLIEGTHLQEKPTLSTVDGGIHAITSIRLSRFLDLAEVEIKGDGYAVPTFVSNFKGGVIKIIGFPNRTGRLTAASGLAEKPGTSPLVRKGGYSLRHNARTEDGFSGAGVFDVNGNLVGIHGQSDLLVSANGSKYLSSSGQAIPIKFWIDARSQGGLAMVSSANYPAPSTATDFSLMGSERLSAARTVEALAFFEKAEKLEPDEVSHLGNKATALIALQRFHEALTILNKGIQMDPINIQLRLVRASAFYELASNLESLNDLNWVLDKASRHPVALQDRAQVLVRLNRLEDAEQDLNFAIQQLVNPINALRLRAKIYLLKKQQRSAMADLNQILEIDEADAANWVNRASLYIQMGDYSAARHDLKAALIIDKMDPYANKIMGILEVMSGNPKTAIPLLEIAIRLRPADTDSHAYLGQSYFKVGLRSKACSELMQAIKHGQMSDRKALDPEFLASCK